MQILSGGLQCAGRNMSDPRDARNRADGRSAVRDASPFGRNPRPHAKPGDESATPNLERQAPEIVAKRRQLQSTVPSLHLKLIAEVFTTSFKDGDRTIIVSSLTEDCASSQVAPNEGDCPARVAEVHSGKLRILKSLSEFRFRRSVAKRATTLRRIKTLNT